MRVLGGAMAAAFAAYEALNLQFDADARRRKKRQSNSNDYIPPFIFKMACIQNVDLRCVLISHPSSLCAGAKKARLESRI